VYDALGSRKARYLFSLSRELWGYAGIQRACIDPSKLSEVNRIPFEASHRSPGKVMKPPKFSTITESYGSSAGDRC
jgi:hypothetical protein